ncbi:zinc finger FYVE domain-containing protein 1-like isoform X2 [Zootermopsis nevadensis]|uniref:zinc finger FYVE domain-containing protein 1-like isoform X2 n=1 Tax=Zootermopsis nevadensis TaxID=136037 RepID=UPI000B8E3311|nr:zinc finger FYVE domain-containing protein 1-like isoform X2 [Zootermopsis nevadensis]
MELPLKRQRTVLRTKMSNAGSAIMKSIDSPSLLGHSRLVQDPYSENKSMGNLPPDVTLTSEFTSLKLGTRYEEHNGGSFLLLDGKENLKVSSAEQFLGRLNCDNSTRVKVVSVFGNTGDGKSHTLNQTFFEGGEVFSTSSEQDSCTLGVWVAYDPHMKVICLDTEGLLGSTSHENQRTRLLLKVLALSDIVIYRTRSERLHRDMFTFLGSASRAYTQHFQAALQVVGQRNEFGGPLSALGPAVIIFHETRHTRTLQASLTDSAEDLLRNRFAQNKLEIEAFSSLRYVGIQTLSPPTDFSDFRAAVQSELENTTVRSPRQPQVVFHTLKVLNDKFNGELENSSVVLFPDQYFTCPIKCSSCERRCESSMGHLKDGLHHSCAQRCRYQHQFDNCMYICKICHSNGKEVVVTPKLTASTDTSLFGFAKFAWSGYVIECPYCGEIYRSRQYWYGNKNPEDIAVRTEIQHVWPDNSSTALGSQNAAQKVLDGVTYISEAVASVGSPPTRMLSSWVADQIAPKYWRPNHEIKHCHSCNKWFATTVSKHHCRACGEGFCEDCSNYVMPVPDRGWMSPVRVCVNCYQKASSSRGSGILDEIDDTEVRARKYGEAVVSTLSTVASVLEYPRGLIKDKARPSYWVPDHEVTHCCCCQVQFGPRITLHHCRDCGRGVCKDCSMNRRAVPHRGWDNPVRICNKCMKQD